MPKSSSANGKLRCKRKSSAESTIEMVYLAFIFALALACVAGMEFVYLMGLETRNRQLKRRIIQLERDNSRLEESLRHAGEQSREPDEEEEAWPELIDDRSLG